MSMRANGMFLLLGGVLVLCWFGAKPVGARSDDTGGQARDTGEQSSVETQTTHKHTNRLINATSPYLLQHAHNPVDWYESDLVEVIQPLLASGLLLGKRVEIPAQDRHFLVDLLQIQELPYVWMHQRVMDGENKGSRSLASRFERTRGSASGFPAEAMTGTG